MKKGALLFFLAFFMLFIGCQDIKSNENEEIYARGYSLENAGIELNIQDDQMKEMITNILQDSEQDNKNYINGILYAFEPKFRTDNPVLKSYGTLYVEGQTTELTFQWSETNPQALLPSGIETTMGLFQAYKKTDIDAGEAIYLDFQCWYPEKQDVKIDSEYQCSLLLRKDDIEQSHYLIGETDDYYIFNWLDIIIDNFDSYLYKNALDVRQYCNDSYIQDIDLAMYLTTMPVIRREVIQALTFDQK